jgi:hypothetical protein
MTTSRSPSNAIYGLRMLCQGGKIIDLPVFSIRIQSPELMPASQHSLASNHRESSYPDIVISSSSCQSALLSLLKVCRVDRAIGIVPIYYQRCALHCAEFEVDDQALLQELAGAAALGGFLMAQFETVFFVNYWNFGECPRSMRVGLMTKEIEFAGGFKGCGKCQGLEVEFDACQRANGLITTTMEEVAVGLRLGLLLVMKYRVKKKS